MAVRVNGPALVLTVEDVIVLDAMLQVAVRDMKRRDSTMPPVAQHLVDGINRIAREFRASAAANTVVKAEFESVIDRPGFVARSSEASEVLSSQDVARMAGISEQAVTSLARRGVLSGTQLGSRGPWRLDRSSVDLWMAARSHSKAA